MSTNVTKFAKGFSLWGYIFLCQTICIIDKKMRNGDERNERKQQKQDQQQQQRQQQQQEMISFPSQKMIW